MQSIRASLRGYGFTIERSALLWRSQRENLCPIDGKPQMDSTTSQFITSRRHFVPNKVVRKIMRETVPFNPGRFVPGGAAAPLLPKLPLNGRVNGPGPARAQGKVSKSVSKWGLLWRCGWRTGRSYGNPNRH